MPGRDLFALGPDEAEAVRVAGELARYLFAPREGQTAPDLAKLFDPLVRGPSKPLERKGLAGLREAPSHFLGRGAESDETRCVGSVSAIQAIA